MSKIEEDKKDNGTISKTEKKVAPKKKNKTAIKPDESVKKVKTQNDIKVKKEIAEEKIENEETAEKIEKKEEIESKCDTVSLEEIKEVLGNKVKKSQKSYVIKEALINFGIALFMIIHLVLLFAGSKNIEMSVFEKDMKIMTLFIALIGIIVLEVSYTKDKIKLALNAVEILVFGAANLCLIYVGKLYMDEFLNFSLYVGAALIGYYIIKIISVSIVNVRKYKKENNDIKEIVKR